MKVQIIKTGEAVTHSSAWRLAFPAKGCVGRPADAEAVAAVEADIATTSGQTRERLLAVMLAAGTYPVELPKPPQPMKQPEPEPVVVDETVKQEPPEPKAEQHHGKKKK